MTISSPRTDAASTADYLAAMDAALARLPLAQRVAILEDAICRADRAERALFNWAAGMGGGEPPVPFTAFEISTISIELSKRLVAAREEGRSGMSPAEIVAASVCVLFAAALTVHSLWA